MNQRAFANQRCRRGRHDGVYRLSVGLFFVLESAIDLTNAELSLKSDPCSYEQDLYGGRNCGSLRHWGEVPVEIKDIFVGGAARLPVGYRKAMKVMQCASAGPAPACSETILAATARPPCGIPTAHAPPRGVLLSSATGDRRRRCCHLAGPWVRGLLLVGSGGGENGELGRGGGAGPGVGGEIIV